MLTFEKLVETLIKMRDEHRAFSWGGSLCAAQGMDYIDYDYNFDTYEKPGYGVVVIERNRKGEIGGIRAWKYGSHEYIIDTINKTN